MKINFFSSICNSLNQYLTWLDYAKNIYNISHDEVVLPNTSSVKDIDYIEIFNKKTFRISDVINYAKKLSNDPFVVLNSDIEISVNREKWKALVECGSKGLVIGNRYNYDKSYKDGLINLSGIDFFIIPNKLIVPHDDYFSFGVCGWDWWIPFLSQQQNIQIYKTNFPFVFHKIHKKRWSNYQLDESKKHFLRATGQYSNKEFKNKILEYAKYI